MTIPGMLITGGVIFLIIALVIFIVTGNKKPKTNKEVVVAQDSSKQEAAVAATPAVGQAVSTSEPVATPQPVVTSERVVPATPISSMAEKVAPQETEPAVFTTPIPQDVTSAQEPTINNQVSNAVEQNVQTVSHIEPATSQITQPIMPTQSEAAPAISTMKPTPVVNQPVVPEIPVKEERKEVFQTPNINIPRPIYGGASPIVPNVPHEEEHRPIYGGANPLENTQSVPIVPQRPVATEEVKVAVPTVEIPTVPVTPSVTPQVSNDIFTTSSLASTPVVPQPVEPTVAVQPTVNQTKPEEIESLF